MTRIRSRISLGLFVAHLLPSRAKDVCTFDQHCMNNGLCHPANDHIDHRHCVCPEGFSGPRCADYCPLTCQNEGYCTLKPKGGALGNQDQTPTYKDEDYICKCYPQYTGDFCEIPYTNCGDQHRCFHGGECISSEHSCRCPAGYTGDSCEEVSDEPSSSTVAPGTFIPNEPQGSQLTKENGKSNSAARPTLLILFTLLLVGCLFWRRRRRRHHGKHYGDGETVPQLAPVMHQRRPFRDQHNLQNPQVELQLT